EVSCNEVDRNEVDGDEIGNQADLGCEEGYEGGGAP
ncbi:MAG: hypothetical protein QOG60_78, partial [Frankiaceae bacterium]|nr:hypothetical protein [Frankiaceae bacterium]